MEHLKLVLAVTEAFGHDLKGTGHLDSKGHPLKFADCPQEANLILDMMSYVVFELSPLREAADWSMGGRSFSFPLLLPFQWFLY